MSYYYFQGQKLPLQISFHPEKRSHLHVHNEAIQASLCYDLSSQQQHQQLKILIEKLYRQSTFKIVNQTLEILTRYLPKKINQIRIKKMRSRWGSCSANNNLNFNLDLAKLPPEIQQYIVIHEVCHLFQMNHSPHFWAIVSKFDADYKLHRKTLRHFEKQFHLKKETL